MTKDDSATVTIVVRSKYLPHAAHVKGSALALHCFRNRKLKIRPNTVKSWPLKISCWNLAHVITDYVGRLADTQIWVFDRYGGDFSPNRSNITVLWLFDCPVLIFSRCCVQSNRCTDFYRTALNTWRSSREKGVCPFVSLSVCLSVCLSNAWIVTKRKKNLSRFLYHTKDQII